MVWVPFLALDFVEFLTNLPRPSDTPQHVCQTHQAWSGNSSPPSSFQTLNRTRGQVSLFAIPLSAPPGRASAPRLQPPLSSALKSTVSLFWVTAHHAQGISIVACGVSDSLRPLTKLTHCRSNILGCLPPKLGGLDSCVLTLGPIEWKLSSETPLSTPYSPRHKNLKHAPSGSFPDSKRLEGRQTCPFLPV